jgi:prepilin-type N-terminal cleavage/methylation domain-containing protein
MNKQAFTLLELIIVLALLAILASVAVARFVDLTKKALDIQERATMHAVGTAVLLYKAQYDAWPDGDPSVWNPFMLLENPPPYEINWPFNDPDPNNRNWFLLRDGNGLPYNNSYWRIWCPHASNSSPWEAGWEWAYMVQTGYDAWTACGAGNCVHQAGQVLEVIGWRKGH